jgi:hypothetical protein
LPAFVVVALDSGHSNCGEMKSKCCFDLHLFCNQRSWTLPNVFTGHFFLFLWEEENSYAHFFIGVLILQRLSFCVPYRFWILDPYQMSSWQRFFSHSVGFLLNLVTVSFTVQKLFSLMQSHLFILPLKCWAFWVLFRKSFLIPLCSSVFPTTSWSCFKISGLILRCLIHFQVISIPGKSFSPPHMDIQFSQQHLLKRLSFLHHVFWTPLSKISWP